MPDYNVHVNLGDLPATFSDATLEAAKRQAMDAATMLIQDDIKQALTSHVRTGRTRASVTRSFTADRGVIGSNVEAARILEYGSRPHVIRPRTKKALKFPTSGRSAAGLGRGPQGTLKGRGVFAFAKSVNHPGTKAYHLFGDSLHKSLPSVVSTFERFLRQALS